MSARAIAQPTGAESIFRRMVTAATRQAAHELDAGADITATEARRDKLLRQQRDEFTGQFGFAVVTGGAIAAMDEAAGAGPFVEVGAGNGYLSRQLQQRGWDVTPTDPNRPEDSGYPLGSATHTAILPLDGRVAVRLFPGHSLIWSWPSLDNRLAHVIAEFDGETVIYIGERLDGCTGGPAFQEELRSRYKTVAKIELPNFPLLRDRVEVMKRRS